MSDVDGLTPEEIAALKRLAQDGDLLRDEAERQKERRQNVGKMSASVSKTDWTEREARHNGLMGSLNSATVSLNNRLDKIKRLEEGVPQLRETLAMVEAQVREFEGQSGE